MSLQGYPPGFNPIFQPTFPHSERAAVLGEALGIAEAMRAEWKTWKLGIEIEFCGINFSTAIHSAAQALRRPGQEPVVVGGGSGAVVTTRPSQGRSRGWLTFKSDPTSCIGNAPGISRGDKLEVVTGHPFWWERDMADLLAVLQAWRAAGGQVTANCGGHVHVDAEPFTTVGRDDHGYRRSAPSDPKMVNALIQLWVTYELYFAHALGVYSNRRGHWGHLIHQRSPQAAACVARDKPTTWAGMRRCWGQNKYQALNLNNMGSSGKNTIEVRLPNGTLDPEQLMAHVQLALAIVLYAAKARAWRRHRPTKQVDRISARYDMHVLMNTLGLIGPEFRAARERLIRNFAGNPAVRTAEQAARSNRTMHPNRVPAGGASESAARGPGAQWGGSEPGVTSCWGNPRGFTPEQAVDLRQWGKSHSGRLWARQIADRERKPRWFAIQYGNGKFFASYNRRTGQNPPIKQFWLSPAGYGQGGGNEVRWATLAYDTWQEAAEAVAAYLRRHPNLQAGPVARPTPPSRQPTAPSPRQRAAPSSRPNYMPLRTYPGETVIQVRGPVSVDEWNRLLNWARDADANRRAGRPRVRISMEVTGRRSSYIADLHGVSGQRIKLDGGESAIYTYIRYDASRMRLTWAGARSGGDVLSIKIARRRRSGGRRRY